MDFIYNAGGKIKVSWNIHTSVQNDEDRKVKLVNLVSLQIKLFVLNFIPKWRDKRQV